MKLFTLFPLFLLFVLPLHAQGGQTYTTHNLPKVHLQDKTKYVCNPAGILSDRACHTIDSLLYALEQQTGIETVVAAVPSIGETSCFDFCHQLLNEWGVGEKGKDNGLVVLLVTDQRCIQFYTGYGLEGVLPDALCKRIQLQYMLPYLKHDRWDEGMVAGMRATCARLDGSMANDTPGGTPLDNPLALFGLLVAAAALGMGYLLFTTWQRNRCPRCKKHKLQRSGTRLLANTPGMRTEKETYTCLNCGYTFSRRKVTLYERIRHRRGGGPFIGGFGGGHIGGGFGGGGSFGGGSGGGGGAGSRF